MPEKMTPGTLAAVAERFKGLAEPARLQILQLLRSGEMPVHELVDASGLGQANVSRHLRLLHGLGFVRRRKEGLYVYYALADRRVLQLCDLMCGHLHADAQARRKALGTRQRPIANRVS